MRISIGARWHRTHVQVRTWNGVVTYADAPGYQWALGRRVGTLTFWLDEHRIPWRSLTQWRWRDGERDRERTQALLILEYARSIVEASVEEKKIGKITSISFGKGGYDDVMIGVSFTFAGPGWGVQDFWGTWSMAWTARCKWTDAERIQQLGEMTMRVNALLNDAKVKTVDQLVDVPVEATFESNMLKSWRILTEVL